MTAKQPTATKHRVLITDAKGGNVLAIKESKLVWADAADGGNAYCQWMIVTDSDHVLVRNCADPTLNLSGNAEGEIFITDRTSGAGTKALSIMKSGSDVVFRLHGTSTTLSVSSPLSSAKVSRFRITYLNKSNGRVDTRVQKTRPSNGLAPGFVVLIVLACVLVLCVGGYVLWRWWGSDGTSLTAMQETVSFKPNTASMGPASGSLFDYFDQ